MKHLRVMVDAASFWGPCPGHGGDRIGLLRVLGPGTLLGVVKPGRPLGSFGQLHLLHLVDRGLSKALGCAAHPAQGLAALDALDLLGTSSQGRWPVVSCDG